MTKAEALSELWVRGVLRWQMRPHAQTAAYDWIDAHRKANPDSVAPLVLNCHRRFGKTYLVALKLVEDAIRTAGRVIRFIAPLYNQLEGILHPVLRTILQTAPPGTYTKTGDVYYFPHRGEADSELHLHGADADRADRLRGMASDAIAIDEARDIENLSYLTTDVLLHHFHGRKDPLFLLQSTPPQSMDHDLSALYIPRAIERGTYLCVPGSSNPDFTERDKNMLLAEVGDEKSESWRREIECELISSSEHVIIPELAGMKGTVVVPSYQRPLWWIPLTGGDLGMTRDATVMLFGYVDWDEARLVIEDELLAVYRNTTDLASMIKAKEEALGYARWQPDGKPDNEYPGPAGHRVQRFADGMASQHFDFASIHGLHLELPDKYEKDLAINSCRDLIAAGRIRIFERCKHLKYQLEHGTYNKQRTDFARSARLYHCDGVDALVYLNRMAPWNTNPKKYPRNTDPEKFEWDRRPRNDDATVRALSPVIGLLERVRGVR